MALIDGLVLECYHKRGVQIDGGIRGCHLAHSSGN